MVVEKDLTHSFKNVSAGVKSKNAMFKSFL